MLEVLYVGTAFYADVGAAVYRIGAAFTVVRRTEPVRVPSLSREVAPEEWVGTARLKHVFQNIGYFILDGQRLKVDPYGVLEQFAGKMVEYKNLAVGVQKGDWVLKER